MTDPGPRIANLRSAIASASARLLTLLEMSRIDGQPTTMSAAAEDMVALAQACLELALQEDDAAAVT